MSELAVPEQALIELHAACNREANADDFYGADYYSDEVRAIAAPVVAAELRRRADRLGWEADRVIDYDSNILREIERDLRHRANELAPEETT